MSDRIEVGADPWKAIPRAVLRDPKLSLRAKGALVTLLSHDAGWVRSFLAVLCRENSCGEKQARSALQELVKAGYVRLDQNRASNGRFRTGYVVSPHRLGTTSSHGTPALPGGGNGDAVEGGGSGGGRDPLPGGGGRHAVNGQAVQSHAVVEPDVEPRDVEPPKDLEPSSEAAPLDIERAEIMRLCVLLADLVEANGAKRPSIGERWRDACRLMLDRDGRSAAQVEAVMRWASADDFWRSNILSMPKLREKFDQLSLRMRANGKVDRASEIHAQAEELRKVGL